MNVIQQSVWEHNERWYRNNLDILKKYVEQLKQGEDWPAFITFACWGKSEKRRLQLWEHTRKEYQLPHDSEALQQEEQALFAEIDEVRESTP